MFLEVVIFGGMKKKQRSCHGRGRGAQRPVWDGNELKKTGARSARARTRGQNPLILYNKIKNLKIPSGQGMRVVTVRISPDISYFYLDPG